MPAIRMTAALALCAALSAAWSAQAADRELTAQQQRMKSCNAQASKQQIKGDERQEFMSQCLKGEQRDLTAQQEKMVSCNRTAKTRKLTGDERQAFMKDCLSADDSRGRSAATGR